MDLRFHRDASINKTSIANDPRTPALSPASAWRKCSPGLAAFPGNINSSLYWRVRKTQKSKALDETPGRSDGNWCRKSKRHRPGNILEGDQSRAERCETD